MYVDPTKLEKELRQAQVDAQARGCFLGEIGGFGMPSSDAELERLKSSQRNRAIALGIHVPEERQNMPPEALAALRRPHTAFALEGPSSAWAAELEAVAEPGGLSPTTTQWLDELMALEPKD